MDYFNFAEKLVSIGFLGIKLAFIDQQTEDYDNNMFAETVSTNRGLLAKVFKDPDEAEKWLLA